MNSATTGPIIISPVRCPNQGAPPQQLLFSEHSFKSQTNTKNHQFMDHMILGSYHWEKPIKSHTS
ncbi:hypothetical protein ACTXT7_003911 [Hymenolepis weldensis]